MLKSKKIVLSIKGFNLLLGFPNNKYHPNRRKFRSQTSDNMDRWKAEMGRVREKRRVEKRKVEERRAEDR